MAKNSRNKISTDVLAALHLYAMHVWIKCQIWDILTTPIRAIIKPKYFWRLERCCNISSVLAWPWFGTSWSLQNSLFDGGQWCICQCTFTKTFKHVLKRLRCICYFSAYLLLLEADWWVWQILLTQIFDAVDWIALYKRYLIILR